VQEVANKYTWVAARSSGSRELFCYEENAPRALRICRWRVGGWLLPALGSDNGLGVRSPGCVTAATLDGRVQEFSGSDGLNGFGFELPGTDAGAWSPRRAALSAAACPACGLVSNSLLL